MVVPKIAVCPICNNRIYLRIQDGSYLNSYPIRISCLKCHAIIKGVYRMTTSSGTSGLHLFNAQIEECDVVPTNNNTVIVQNADCVAEVSGELPCKKVKYYDKFYHSKNYSTPFMDATKQTNMMQIMENLRSFVKNQREWHAWKSISFQLLSEGSFDYLPIALNNKMGNYEYPCDNNLKSFQCLQAIVLEQTKMIFWDTSQEKYIGDLIKHISAIDDFQLHSLVKRIGGISTVILAFQKNMDLFCSFMEIYPHILPAITYMTYKEKDNSDIGLSTCSFFDVKSFYQDAYESLLSTLYIPVSIDNILTRNNYDDYNSTFSSLFVKKRYANLSDNLERYQALDNGMKAENICNEIVQNALNIPAKRLLRNAIGHNNYKYDNAKQIITFFDVKHGAISISLLEMAKDCIGLAKSSVIMSEVLLFIMRHELRNEGIHSIIPMQFYNDNQPNDKCPCGSNIKYKKCCKFEVDRLKNNI